MRPVVEQHQHGGAEHGDGGGLQMQRPRQHEGDHHRRSSTTSDCLSSSQSSMVSAALIAMHARLGAGVALSVLAPEQMDHQRLHHHDDDDHRREVDDEIVEVEADLRADQDVGRIADQRRGAADIGGEDFGEQIGIGRHLQLLA